MRVFIDKERMNQVKEDGEKLDELCMALLAEESRCNGCLHQCNVSIVYCRNCEIYGNIKEVEKTIRELLEILERNEV